MNAMKLRLGFLLLIVFLLHPVVFSIKPGLAKNMSDYVFKHRMNMTNINHKNSIPRVNESVSVGFNASISSLDVGMVYSNNNNNLVNESVITGESSCKPVPPCACQAETGIFQLRPLAQLLAEKEGDCVTSLFEQRCV